MDKMSINEKLDALALKIPDILFPKNGIDLSKFSCLAMGEYFDNSLYWDAVKKYVGNEISTYNLIFPKAEYLKVKESDREKAIKEKAHIIKDTMKRYIDDKIYESIGECLIFVERKARTQNRRGLLFAVDLSRYGNEDLIRASYNVKETDVDFYRKLSEDAVLDLSHIVLLIDDKEDRLFKKVESIKFATFFKMSGESKNDILYDFDLTDNAGYIKGYKIVDNEDIEAILDTLLSIKNENKDSFMYVVADGNCKIKALKENYEKTGKNRYALVEIVNAYESGIQFLSIKDKKESIKAENVFDDMRKGIYAKDKEWTIGEAQDKRFYLEII